MSVQKKTALVTGANKGIGYEIARGLGRLGFSVGVGARDEQRREDAVATLQGEGLDVFGVPLDVSDDASVATATRLIEERGAGLDVLVNNAAITGAMPQEPTQIAFDEVRRVLETNVLGVMRVTNALLPLLRQAPSPRIVNMSSGVGSLTLQGTPGSDVGPISAGYSTSKTLLNAVMLQYVRELQGSGILINNACPGYVATDLNGRRGTRTPEQGARAAIHLATLPDDGPTGGYFNEDGPLPW